MVAVEDLDPGAGVLLQDVGVDPAEGHAHLRVAVELQRHVLEGLARPEHAVGGLAGAFRPLPKAPDVGPDQPHRHAEGHRDVGPAEHPVRVVGLDVRKPHALVRVRVAEPQQRLPPKLPGHRLVGDEDALDDAEVLGAVLGGVQVDEVPRVRLAAHGHRDRLEHLEPGRGHDVRGPYDAERLRLAIALQREPSEAQEVVLRRELPRGDAGVPGAEERQEPARQQRDAQLRHRLLRGARTRDGEPEEGHLRTLRCSCPGPRDPPAWARRGARRSPPGRRGPGSAGGGPWPRSASGG